MIHTHTTSALCELGTSILFQQSIRLTIYLQEHYDTFRNSETTSVRVQSQVGFVLPINNKQNDK